MGSFDSMFGGLEASRRLSPQESFAGILIAASACDGHVSEDEFNGLIAALLRMKLYQKVNEKEFRGVVNKMLGILKKKGPEVLAEACIENLPEQLVKPAFANACNLVLADGTVEPEEKEFMDKLRALLKLDEKTAKTIAQVMVIKNKG